MPAGALVTTPQANMTTALLLEVPWAPRVRGLAPGAMSSHRDVSSSTLLAALYSVGELILNLAKRDMP